MRALPIRQKILFAFLNETGGQYGAFKDVRESGIILSTVMDTQKAGRWAKALLVGPECKDVKAGHYIFIRPLMWSIGFKYDDVKIWQTDELQILATSDDVPEYQVS